MSAERAPLVPHGSDAYGAVVRALQPDRQWSDSDSQSVETLDEATAEAEEAERRRRDFGVGIALLAAVVVLWTASNFVTSSLVSHGTASPFFITYLNTSVFMLYFVPFGFSRTHRPPPTKRHALPTWYHSLGFMWPPTETPNVQPTRQRSSWRALLGLPPPAVHSAPASASASARAPSATPRPDTESSAAGPAADLATVHPPPLTIAETSRVAAWFAVLWFVANYAVNTALGLTSVASATTLSSASGLFTLLVGAAAGTEHFTPAKVLATLATLVGVGLVANADSRSSSSQSSGDDGAASTTLVGDALALVSALMYAMYVVYLKRAVGDDSRLSMPFFFALVGLWSVVLFLPLGLILHFTGLETLSLPEDASAWLGVGTNMFITLTSDLAYLLAMLKSSPLAATVGLSLTIPLAAVVDAVLVGVTQTASQVMGDTLVLASFVGIGWTESFEATADAVQAVHQEFLAAEGMPTSDPAHPARRFSRSRSRPRSRSRSVQQAPLPYPQSKSPSRPHSSSHLALPRDPPRGPDDHR